MAVNANIPLAGSNAVNTGGAIIQANQAGNQNALATEQILKAHYDAMDAREKSRLTSTIAGATQLKAYLDRDDIEGAHEFLQRRQQALHARMANGENIDTQETDYALDALRRGNIDQLKNDVGGIIAAGQVYGIIGGMQGAPSNVQEWQYFNSLTPQDQQRYLQMKRSNQTLNLGGSQMVVGPTGQPVANYDVTLKPEDQPANARAKAEATATGTAAGESAATATNTMNKVGGLLSSLEMLKTSAGAAPSGALGNAVATGANQAGVGGAAAQAQGDFRVKRAAAENDIRQAFRVAGSGATSDRDALPFIQMLPEENDAADVKVAKTNAAMEAVRAKVQDLARQRGLPDPFAMPQGGAPGAPGGQKIRVVKGNESYLIDPADLAAAQAEGFVQQ